MRNHDSIMQEYEVSLPVRASDYQAAQADGQRLQAWVSAAIHGVGSQLVAWGQALQPEPGRPEWQHPPQA